jgi:hypothetical protein
MDGRRYGVVYSIKNHGGPQMNTRAEKKTEIGIRMELRIYHVHEVCVVDIICDCCSA